MDKDGNHREPWQVLTVGENEKTIRLDAWLAARVEGLSRRRAQGMVKSGEVTVNRRASRKGAEVHPGDEVMIWVAPASDDWCPAPDGATPIDILYEDADLVVVEKPGGIPSVPLTETETGTLAGRVAHQYPECRAVKRKTGDGGLVQRLDRGTSGAVLVARSQRIHDQLVSLQRAGGIEKTYLALIDTSDTEPPGVICTPLAPRGPRGRKMIPAPDGLAARTTVDALARHGCWTFVQAVIHRGARHQIRAHLAGAGTPVVGDEIYGRGGNKPSPGRLFLHCHALRFRHPRTNEPVVVESPLPVVLRQFLDSIGVSLSEVGGGRKKG